MSVRPMLLLSEEPDIMQGGSRLAHVPFRAARFNEIVRVSDRKQ